MLIRPGLGRPAVHRGRWLTFDNPVIATTMSIAAARLGAGAFGTYLIRVTLTGTGVGTTQSLIQIDSGSGANRYLLSQASGTAQTTLTRTTASAGSSQNLGTVVAGTPFSLAMAVDGAGGAIGSLNGAATLSVTGGPTSGLTDFRIGVASGGGAPIVAGTIHSVRLLPDIALSAAELQALAAQGS